MEFTGEGYRRKDGRFAWRVRAGNGKIVATDGAQGYENKADCKAMFYALFPGGRLAWVD